MYMNFWYAMAQSRDVTQDKPLRLKRLNQDFVLWRDEQGQAQQQHQRSQVAPGLHRDEKADRGGDRAKSGGQKLALQVKEGIARRVVGNRDGCRREDDETAEKQAQGQDQQHTVELHLGSETGRERHAGSTSGHRLSLSTAAMNASPRAM